MISSYTDGDQSCLANEVLWAPIACEECFRDGQFGAQITLPCMRAAICPGVSGFAMVVEDVLGAASALLAIKPMIHAHLPGQSAPRSRLHFSSSNDKPYAT